MTVTYISWCWQKSGDDGRRASGRVVKRGVWHIASAIDRCERYGIIESAHTICGREANMYIKESGVMPNGVICKRCLARLSTGNVSS